MVCQQERQALAFASRVHIQKSKAAGIDDFIRRLHRSKFKRLAGLPAFARADTVPERLIDFEHIREGIMPAILELEQERRAGVECMVDANEQISGCGDGSVL